MLYSTILFYTLWNFKLDLDIFFEPTFSGIPGCAKSALCKELLNAPGGLGDDRPVHSLMGDLIKGMANYPENFVTIFLSVGV